MIKIITLEREYGSGGGVVAQKLAERLEWKLWDQFLTNEIARSMKCGGAEIAQREEKRDSLGYRLLKSFMRGTFEGNVNAPGMQLLDADCIFETTARVIQQAANAGNGVIVGRGGAYFLKDRPDAYHVFLYAPPEDKIRRLKQSGKSAAEAKELVESVDQERAAFIKKYFNIQWPTFSRYHLMINSHIGDEAVVDMILAGIALVEKPQDAASRN
jgi:cytidylate kinase